MLKELTKGQTITMNVENFEKRAKDFTEANKGKLFRVDLAEKLNNNTVKIKEGFIDKLIGVEFIGLVAKVKSVGCQIKIVPIFGFEFESNKVLSLDINEMTEDYSKHVEECDKIYYAKGHKRPSYSKNEPIMDIINKKAVAVAGRLVKVTTLQGNQELIGRVDNIYPIENGQGLDLVFVIDGIDIKESNINTMEII